MILCGSINVINFSSNEHVTWQMTFPKQINIDVSGGKTNFQSDTFSLSLRKKFMKNRYPPSSPSVEVCKAERSWGCRRASRCSLAGSLYKWSLWSQKKRERKKSAARAIMSVSQLLLIGHKFISNHLFRFPIYLLWSARTKILASNTIRTWATLNLSLPRF